ncbi:MAG: HEPN domain-containing protein [Ignavibacteriales bacterium]|nr:HEPN domain-containing protein [Ignavibacteriales bacterium]
MDNSFTPQDWLKRAKSNLNIGKESNNLEEREIFLEDLCFNLQQSVEKSLKALLIYCGIDFPKTHDILRLLKTIEKRTTIIIPDYIKDAIDLTPYAVKTRYPNWNSISDEKYKQAVVISENVYNWVNQLIIK